jgi:hypothetical protein
MKTFIVILFSILTFHASFAQMVDAKYVPEAVKKSFAKKFPDAGYVTWSQDVPGFINANFSQDKKKMQAMFINSGGWVSTETTLKEPEFPQEAVNWMKSNFPEAKYTSLTKSETTKGIEYESEIKAKDGNKYRLTFDIEGKMLTQNIQK